MKASPRNNAPLCLLSLLFALSFISHASIIRAQSGVMRPRVSSPPPRPTTVQPTGQSTVKGRVFYKDTAQPLKGTRVRIFTSSDAGLVAFTNDRGEFRVDNLAAGKYYVTLEGKGMAMQSG